jgi:hypothetical protein
MPKKKHKPEEIVAKLRQADSHTVARLRSKDQLSGHCAGREIG